MIDSPDLTEKLSKEILTPASFEKCKRERRLRPWYLTVVTRDKDYKFPIKSVSKSYLLSKVKQLPHPGTPYLRGQDGSNIGEIKNEIYARLAEIKREMRLYIDRKQVRDINKKNGITKRVHAGKLADLIY